MGYSDGYFTLDARMHFQHTKETLFPFFADAQNLERITPPWLHFRILSAMPIYMKEGAEIEYRLRLHGIRLKWLSEITVWEPPDRFVDQQRRGPYREWIHEHSFADISGGCEMRDYVRYSVFGGRIVHSLIVKHNVSRIFEYRAEELQQIFSA
jgi:ligand-binding SRPBCC domain-containing protein